VVEILDMKVRNLKKKNDMIMSENENLRTELKLLCAADQNVHNDFTNSKI
jgi:FtsZ-binding cell division protein ZapB